MKKLNFIVPNDQHFNLSEELFLLELGDVQKVSTIGQSVNRLMRAMQAILHTAMNTHLKLVKPFDLVRDIFLRGLDAEHKKIIAIHPQRNSLITRVDFMIDNTGELKIAEIDPMNKHGLGFALLCRNENGHGESQKILTLFAEQLNDYQELVVLISRKDEFFQKEQEYFAEKLSEYTGKLVSVLTETEESEIIKRVENTSCCFMDCPSVDGRELNQMLVDTFMSTPKRFLIPPKHWMGNKAVLSFLYEPMMLKVLRAFLSDEDICLLQMYIPPTYIIKPTSERFVVKKVLSSGAKGVFFNGNAPDENVIYQKYVNQKKFLLEGKDQHVRLAAHFVGTKLGELTVTSSVEVPVHGNSESVNFHVGLKS